MRFTCSYCSRTIVSHNDFCPGCGAPISRSVPELEGAIVSKKSLDPDEVRDIKAKYDEWLATKLNFLSSFGFAYNPETREINRR